MSPPRASGASQPDLGVSQEGHHPGDLASLAECLTITVPEAGRLLGIGRDAAYAAAERGELPCLRLGRRLVVPVPRLLDLLGVTSTQSPPCDPPKVGAVR